MVEDAEQTGNFLAKELQGGGLLIDVGTHALDLTLWLMDNYEPKTILGVTYDYIGTHGTEANQGPCLMDGKRIPVTTVTQSVLPLTRTFVVLPPKPKLVPQATKPVTGFPAFP
jgi:hypothetical protein